MLNEAESVASEAHPAKGQLKIAVMQPYFLPYLGYFHLIDAVDKFIILDDVKYSKNGWVNRNRILINHELAWLTVPVAKSGSLLREKRYLVDGPFLDKLNRKISRAYPASSDRDFFLELLKDWARGKEPMDSVVELNVWMLKKLLSRLPVSKPEFHLMSSFNIQLSSDPTERIIRAVKTLGGEVYVNLSGGRSLYSRHEFIKNGVELRFVDSQFPPYPQSGNAFVPGLSVIDFLLSQESNREDWVGPKSYELGEDLLADEI
jgi:hypothetical protein